MAGPRNVFLRYLRGAGAGSLVISVVVHLILLGGATAWVVTSVQEQRKTAFQGGPGNSAPAERRLVEHRVQMSRQQSSLSTVTQRLAVDSPNASVSLPDLPDMPGFSGAGPALSGSLGGTGDGGGMGSPTLSRGPLMPAFGFREAQPGGTLVGRFYDLKQSRMRKANPELAKIGPGRLAIKEVSDFIQRGWSRSALREFFDAPQPLYATQIFVPVMAADEAPKAYGVEKEAQPRAWLAHYRGRVSPPATGVYRFVGAGDDLMVVRLDGRLVLDAGGEAASKFESDLPKNRRAYAYQYQKDEWNISRRGGFVVGKRMELKAGQFYDIDIVFSEGPGGLFCAMLLFEQEGVTYAKDGKGNPILPIFRVADQPTAKAATAPVFMENGPVWRALPAPKD